MVEGEASEAVVTEFDGGVNISFYIDPIVDAYFRHLGRTSKRRYRNIMKMRYKAMLQACNLDPMWIKEALSKFSLASVRDHVEKACQPGYSLAFPPAAPPSGTSDERFP